MKSAMFRYAPFGLCPLYRLCLVIFLTTAIDAQAADKWVGPDGDDSNSGLSRAASWKRLTHALINLEPGDTLNIDDGLYFFAEEGGDYNGTAAVRRIGYQRLDGWTDRQTVIRALNPGKVTIIGNLDVVGSFIQIEGLNILGHASNDEPGILLRDSHHIDVVNNEVSYCGGGGVVAAHSDTLRIIGNTLHHNCSRSLQQHSGIAIYQPISQVDPESRYWGIEIKRNLCFENVCWTPGPLGHTDGNGIIVDDYFYTQNTHLQDYHYEMIGDQEVYPHRTLIEGNLCVYNGGGGIRSYLGKRVTIKNNTCVGNNYLLFYWEDGAYDPGGYYNTGNIMLENSEYCHVLNNVMQSHYVYYAPGGSNYAASDQWGFANFWENNLLHSVIKNEDLWNNPMIDNSSFTMDPRFEDSDAYDFAANAGRGLGISWSGHTYIDLNGTVVPPGSPVDLGAIQVASE